MTDPVLSVTVPEKLPVACPYMNEGMQSPTVHAITAQNSLLPIIKHPLPSDMVQRQVVRRCLLGLQKHKHKPKIAILDVSLDEMPQATPNLKHNELKKMMWASYFSTSIVSRPPVYVSQQNENVPV